MKQYIEWNKNIFSFAEYILFTLDKGFYFSVFSLLGLLLPLPKKLKPNKNITCSRTNFVWIQSCLDTEVMLILVLIDVQYSQKAVFSFEKCSNCQFNPPQVPTKKSFPQQKNVSFSKTSDSPPPLITNIWKTITSWRVAGGVQNVRTNILIFEFIIPQISYSVLIKIYAEMVYLQHEY